MPGIIIEVSNRGVCCIPRIIRDKLSVSNGGFLEAKLNDNNELVLSRPAPALLYTWEELSNSLYAGEVDGRLKAAIKEIDYVFREKAAKHE